MKGTSLLEKTIKRIIEENCKKNLYSKVFDKKIETEVEEHSDTIVMLTMQDEDLVRNIEEAIEESIRVFINKKPIE